jgi:hypothetical protein
MSIEDRRQFLKMLGIAAPVGMAVDAPRTVDDTPPRMNANDIFTLYVSEALQRAQERGLATDPTSNVRMFFEIQGAALAAVLAELQGQRHD